VGDGDLLETSLAPLPKEEMQKAMLITARSHLYWVSWPMAVAGLVGLLF
jgi:hypothetical protein